MKLTGIRTEDLRVFEEKTTALAGPTRFLAQIDHISLTPV